MKLHELKPAAGAKKSKIRRGRGDSSGYGSFSGRGCKGQNSRSGGGVRLGFEGGQTSLLRRTPKLKGFKNPNRIEYTAVNLDAIDVKFSDREVVSPETLAEKGLLRTAKSPAKILGRGKLTKKVSFENVKMSATAEKAIAKKPAAAKKEEKKEETAE